MITLRRCAPLLVLGLAVAGSAACGDDAADASSAARSTPSAAATPATNGIDRLPSEKALARSKEAYLKASTVRVKGTVVDGGTNIGLDLRTTLQGDTQGTLTMD